MRANRHLQAMNPTHNTNLHPPSPTRQTRSPPIKMPSSRPASSSSGTRKRADLHLQGLPPFHPAVYQSPASTSSSPFQPHRPPQNTRDTSRLHPKSQQQLRTMQRDLIASMQRNSPSAGISPSSQDTPKAPSLAPALSPGPPTPLNLHEGPHDYLSAGSAGGLSPEKVEEIIRKARDGNGGLGSGPGSPAVSPAGGRT